MIKNTNINNNNYNNITTSCSQVATDNWKAKYFAYKNNK